MGRKVLLVEDNPMNQELMAMLLEAKGYRTLTAEDARSGIELARGEKPDLILMDLQLPGGMDGLEATRILKADHATRGIPIMVVTAHAFQDVLVKAKEAGCDACLTKPLDMHKFWEMVYHYTGEKP